MYNIGENFISSNAYACIEVNGLALIKLIVSLRNRPDLFLPTLFDSQTCEKTFGQLRSLGTINLTKINFSMIELLHMIFRIELQNDIAYFRLADFANFPRISINTSCENKFKMPTNEEITETIRQALKDSIDCAKEFKMLCDPTDVQICQLKKTKIQVSKKNEAVEDESDEETENLFTNRDEEINLKSFEIEILSPDSKYMEIFNPDGSSKIFLKSSIVGLLSESPQNLSNDRLKRVQTIPLQKASKRKKNK